MKLYAAPLLLTSAGYFISIRSDYASNYIPLYYISKYALAYAFTRTEAFRRPFGKGDVFDWNKYVRALPRDKYPIYTTPAIPVKTENSHLEYMTPSEITLDRQIFNVRPESPYGKMPDRFPKYGTIEYMKPCIEFMTFLFSENKDIIKRIIDGRTYLIGFKRVMFTVEEFPRGSKIVETCPKDKGEFDTNCYIELRIGSEILKNFVTYETYDISKRTIVFKGRFRGRAYRAFFPFNDGVTINIPAVYIDEFYGERNKIDVSSRI
ncbi:MAG: hypothetical protein QMD13_03660 [Candidatus Bathyarchaeia archaeon]|nr:hypothetical protein [Candidatus Bathyarchaeia archaeon]